MKTQFIKSFDGTDLNVYIWDDVLNPKGIVQIMHGMSEHAKRYEEFAIHLNRAGYIVYADDHRGHGLTCKDKLGTYQGQDIFEDTVKDEIFISQMLRQTYNLPLYVFGHSYGSFILQAYMTRCDLYDKAILCGSALMKNRLDVFFGKYYAKFLCRTKGPHNPSFKMVDKTFGKYNKVLGYGSWLNTIAEEVDKYNSDSYCGFICSNKFYVDFLSSFNKIYSQPEMINPYKPIFIISGSSDPIGLMGKSVKKLHKYYANLGILNVSFKIYPNARHEILHDICKDETTRDIIAFLD